MQIDCRIYFSLFLWALIANGCGNNTGFTSSNKDKRVQGSDATKADSGPQSEQDEHPSILPEGTPSSGEDGESADDGTDVTLPEEKTDSQPESYKIEREFATTVKEDASIKFIPKLGIMTQEFTLTSMYQNTDLNFTQISRPNVTKMYKQGNLGESITENLLQADQGILDLMIVIDDSGSMKEEQTNLSGKLAPLLEYVKDSDWRIGVVTTSVSRGCSRAVIKKGDSGIDALFTTAISAGITGNSSEQGIRQAVEGLSCPTAAFVRPNSTIAVLIVSDEDNCSDGTGCSAPYNSPAYLTDYLANTLLRKLGTDARVYGLYWDPTKSCVGAAKKANQYAKAVADTFGTSGSICDADYTATLQKISRDVAAILKTEFTLKGTPDLGSVRVKINSVEATTGFTVMGDVLRFTTIPPQGAAIEVKYTVGAVPFSARYATGEKPAANTLRVRLNGNLVAGNEFELDPVTYEVVFKIMPAANSDVKIDFLSDLALLKEFPLGAGVKVSSTKVKINDVATAAFTVNSGKLFLDAAPSDGAIISVNFDRLVGPVLEYSLPFAGTVIKNLVAYDKADSSIVAVSLINGKVVVAESMHIEGKVLILSYKNETSGKIDIVLPYAPIPDSISVDSGAVVCRLGNGLELMDRTLRVTCEFDKEDETTIKFSYKKIPLNKFFIAELMVLKNFLLKVSINDSATAAYTVSAGMISVADEIPYDAVVKVTITSKI